MYQIAGAAQMKELDRQAIEEYGVSSLGLMERAAQGILEACLDLLEEAGETAFDPALFRQPGAEWFVTPRNIDREVETLARILGLGISTALHVDFSVEDVEKWIS